MVIPDSKLKELESGMKNMLDAAFAGRIVFGEIMVETTLDHYGEDNLNFVVVYEGDSDQLDPDKLNTVSMELGSILTSLGFHNFPTESYIHKDEYGDWVALRNLPPWEQEAT